MRDGFKQAHKYIVNRSLHQATSWKGCWWWLCWTWMERIWPLWSEMDLLVMVMVMIILMLMMEGLVIKFLARIGPLYSWASSEDHRPQSRQCPIQKQKLPTRPKNKLQMLNNSVYICLLHPLHPLLNWKKPSLRGNEHLRGAQCIGYYNIGNAFCGSARLATFAYDCLAGF